MVTKRVSWYKRFKFESCHRAMPIARGLKGGGEGPRRAITLEIVGLDYARFAARDCTCVEGT
jgi:hypothetical protein